MSCGSYNECFQALILVWPGKSVLNTKQNGNQPISDLKELNQRFL